MTGTGDMTLTARQVYGGTTTVNEGTLRLGSGVANTLPVLPTATTPTMITLTLNGGALDLDGQNQAVGNLSSTNYNAGMGGSVVNSGAAAATLTIATGTSTTFAGSIGGSGRTTMSISSSRARPR